MSTKNRIRSEDPAPYGVMTTHHTDNDDDIINRALALLDARLRTPGAPMESPNAVKDFLRLKSAELPHEMFSVMLLDNRHGLIEFVELFRGTIDGASVFPREVVKLALAHNAAAVVFSHNHPSGVAEPSRADEHITSRLKDALALVDIRVLDHIIVGGTTTVSFAERGLI
jgi:DNA repair protein RadC